MSVDVTRKVPSFNTGTSSLSPTSGTASHPPTNSLKVTPTAWYNPSIAADTSNHTSILMASSFTLKENSVVNSHTSSGRCVPVHKPIPAVFAAAHNIQPFSYLFNSDTIIS
ncbi:hypothetical protein BU17DRAFT_98362 [Hysterangium stoloniferum]|nr:hypothetical protein BU17DRAFT_98362 [Hysterangium stoloniferum]